jgi:hypothetical protein
LLNKGQMEREITIARRSWEKIKVEIAETIAAGKHDCTLGALEYAGFVQVSLLERLYAEYYVPREYLKCAHCNSRVLVTPELDRKLWQCPNRHLNVKSA